MLWAPATHASWSMAYTWRISTRPAHRRINTFHLKTPHPKWHELIISLFFLIQLFPPLVFRSQWCMQPLRTLHAPAHISTSFFMCVGCAEFSSALALFLYQCNTLRFAFSMYAAGVAATHALARPTATASIVAYKLLTNSNEKSRHIVMRFRMCSALHFNINSLWVALALFSRHRWQRQRRCTGQA